jgi:predicted polyphosphate/ATP-dependent NAD kinase
MVLRIGFIVNPVAGIGGPAGLMGSDALAEEAANRGYEPNAPDKAVRFLARLKERAHPGSIRIFAAPGVMGAEQAQQTGWRTGAIGSETFDADPFSTSPEDTKRAAMHAREVGLDLVVFVGGDGTARDVAAACGEDVPMLGVPAGVKMFSECFTETPEAAADLLAEIARPPRAEGDPVETRRAELMDLDEEAYRAGRVEPRPWGTAQVPRSPRIIAAKCPVTINTTLESVAAEIVARMHEHPDALYLLASGTTLQAIKDRLGIEGSLIGIDAVVFRDEKWGVLARDADAHSLERLARDAGEVVVVLTPIGGQGFILGRGTAPLTPAVLRRALPDGIWIAATREKLASLRDRALHVDTGDPALDAQFPRHVRVIVGTGREMVMPVASEALNQKPEVGRADG